jgi:acetate kinase
LLDSERRTRLLDVRVENIGRQDCRLEVDGERREAADILDLGGAVAGVLEHVRSRAAELGAPQAIAHRIVHGGAQFHQPTVLNDDVLAQIESLNSLAPLHNPPAIEAVRLAVAAYADVPHVAIFDTAWHGTLPRRAREYALPADLRERFGIRRFGFHGVSHAHVVSSVAARMHASPQELRIISCHLGNGASVAAVEYGRSVETSMGMTPLEGLVMGTRVGDIDPGVLLLLLESGMTTRELDELLNRRSGLTGLTGTNDMRRIEQGAAEGDEECRLALALYTHRIRKYIGAYAAVMGGVDAIAFTGGVGENSATVRHRCMQRLEFLGAMLDEDRNRDARATLRTPCIEISPQHSRVRSFVVCADEELEMAIETADALAAAAHGRPDARIPIAVSARHAHLSQATVEALFGAGYKLTPRTALSQPGQYAAEETVTLIGPRGRIENVRTMGPPREHDQVEISRSDEFTLGVDAPVRISGDLSNTPGITLEGPAGRVTLQSGLICARRHIHMNPQDAARLGVKDCDEVAVRIDSEGRDLIFADVSVRVAPGFSLEMHLDTDEANAAGLSSGDYGELVR